MSTPAACSTPTVYLPEAWQQQLITLPGGKLDGDVAIALSGKQIDNTGFILSDGLLSITAEELNNQKRNAYYYDKRKVKGGTLTTWGDTVQPGGFMQAAQWQLAADSIYSRSGEFVVSGTDADSTATLSADFEAQIRAELGDAFVFEEATDHLQTKFKAKKSGLGQMFAAVVTIVVAAYAGPVVSAMIGNITGAAAGTAFAAATAATATTTATAAGLGNVLATSFVTQTLSSSIGQLAASGRVDFNSALKSGLAAGATAGVADWAGSNIENVYGQYAVNKLTAGAVGELAGTGFEAALINAFINDASAYGANLIGNGNFGQQGTIGHTLAHGVLGALTESARGGDGLSGAIGAMTAALLSQPLGNALGVTESDRLSQIGVQALTMLAGGLVANAVGRDPVAAAYAAQNEAIYNYLNHLESTEYTALEEKCGRAASGCSAQEQARMRELEALDKQRDALLADACANPSSLACSTQFTRLNEARLSFVGQDVEGGSRAAHELAWIKQEQARYDARVQNPGAYNIGTVVLELAGEGVKGTLDLATLSAKAATGDSTAQAQLSQVAQAIGQFVTHPIDTVEQHISTTLVEADALDSQGRTDEAQRMRAKLFTEGALTFTGAGSLVVKTSGKVLAKVTQPNRSPLSNAEVHLVVEDARIENNRSRDGAPYDFPHKLVTSDGREILPNPDKTTTVLGSFRTDMRSVINGQLDAPLGDVDFGPSRPGAFNVLNVPAETATRLGDELFWIKVNKPFLDAAIARGDSIALATKPERGVLTRTTDDGQVVTTIFGREYDYMKASGYVYDESSGFMLRRNEN